jgi:hypothetical protein
MRSLWPADAGGFGTALLYSPNLIVIAFLRAGRLPSFKVFMHPLYPALERTTGRNPQPRKALSKAEDQFSIASITSSTPLSSSTSISKSSGFTAFAYEDNSFAECMDIIVVDDPAYLAILRCNFDKPLYLLGGELIDRVQFRDAGVRSCEAPAIA